MVLSVSISVSSRPALLLVTVAIGLHVRREEKTPSKGDGEKEVVYTAGKKTPSNIQGAMMKMKRKMNKKYVMVPCGNHF